MLLLIAEKNLWYGQFCSPRFPAYSVLLWDIRRDPLKVHFAEYSLALPFTQRHSIVSHLGCTTPQCQIIILAAEAIHLHQERASSLKRAQTSSAYTSNPNDGPSTRQPQPAASLSHPGMKAEGAEAAMRASTSQPCQIQGPVAGNQCFSLACGL